MLARICCEKTRRIRERTQQAPPPARGRVRRQSRAVRSAGSSLRLPRLWPSSRSDAERPFSCFRDGPARSMSVSHQRRSWRFRKGDASLRARPPVRGMLPGAARRRQRGPGLGKAVSGGVPAQSRRAAGMANRRRADGGRSGGRTGVPPCPVQTRVPRRRTPSDDPPRSAFSTASPSHLAADPLRRLRTTARVQ